MPWSRHKVVAKVTIEFHGESYQVDVRQVDFDVPKYGPSLAGGSVVITGTLVNVPCAQAAPLPPTDKRGVCRCPIADLTSTGHSADCPER